jgi:predicted nucleic acid-binding protein
MNSYIRFGIKQLDALHVACAAESGCDFFLTVDKGLLRKAKFVQTVQIVNPIDFVVQQGH